MGEKKENVGYNFLYSVVEAQTKESGVRTMCLWMSGIVRIRAKDGFVVKEWGYAVSYSAITVYPYLGFV